MEQEQVVLAPASSRALLLVCLHRTGNKTSSTGDGCDIYTFQNPRRRALLRKSSYFAFSPVFSFPLFPGDEIDYKSKDSYKLGKYYKLLCNIPSVNLAFCLMIYKSFNVLGFRSPLQGHRATLVRRRRTGKRPVISTRQSLTYGAANISNFCRCQLFIR